jgi:hypothetical protein
MQGEETPGDKQENLVALGNAHRARAVSRNLQVQKQTRQLNIQTPNHPNNDELPIVIQVRTTVPYHNLFTQHTTICMHANSSSVQIFKATLAGSPTLDT